MTSSTNNNNKAQLMKDDHVNLFKRRLYAFIPCVFAAVAFCTSYTSNFDCHNIQFIPETATTTAVTTDTSSSSSSFKDDSTARTDTADFFRPRPVSFGLWMYQSQRMTTIQDGEMMYNEFCVGYDPSSVHVDGKWKVARFFSVVGIILSGFLLLWQFAAPFLLFDTNYWRIAIVLFILLAVFQGLTLFIVQSSACYDNALIYVLVYNPKIYPEQCSWDRGTYTSIVSLSFYITTVISMLIIPAPGIRPGERPYPMLVWDTESNKDRNEYNEFDDDEDDDASTSSFACDDDNSDDEDNDTTILRKYQQQKMSAWKQQLEHLDDPTETDVSYSHSGSCNDDDDDEEVDDERTFVQGGTKV